MLTDSDPTVPTWSLSLANNRSSSMLYVRAQDLCERRGGRPGLPVPNSAYGLCGRKATSKKEDQTELRICVKVEVNFLGSPSLMVRTDSVDVKQHNTPRAQELCESGGGRPGLSVIIVRTVSVWT